MLELLAPCGGKSEFERAIACGADAVYLGLPDFNARKKAENFDISELREYVKRAHFFGVKVYVTVNTIVRDGELPALLDSVRAAVEAKADAFIVQDLGVVSCLKESFPGIVLHASTQLGIHNLYGASQAEKLGFKRVVLSRETKLDDIRAIRDGTSLEIEFFVQGALCVAFSGNCYLSAVEQNASGNRGLCKQLCRLPYEAEIRGKKEEGFLLSARDLCLANSLKELIDAGVTSFKIEGRMRRDGYVGTAVSIFRRMLDDILRGKKTELSQLETDRLRIAYCRGEEYLGRAYLDVGTPDVIEKEYNNHTGLPVGDVKEVSSFKDGLYKVAVCSEYALVNGDGLKFFRRKPDGGLEEAASAGVGGVVSCGKNLYRFVTKAEVKVGWRVNLISSYANEQRLRETKRVVKINMSLTALASKPLSLEASSLDGRAHINICGEICQKAKTAPLSENDLALQMCKTADSGFEVCACNVSTDGVFVAKSSLNALRREALALLADKIIGAAEQNTATVGMYQNIIIPQKPDHPDVRFVREDDLDAICTAGHEIVVICPSRYNAEAVCDIIRRLPSAVKDIALQLPVIANGADIKVIEDMLARIPQIKTLVIENIYGFELASRGYSIIAGAGLNVMNGIAAKICADMGADFVLPSVESGIRKGISGVEIPLMTFAHCPYKTINKNICAHCSYKAGMTLSRGGRKYEIRRVQVQNCYFGLFEKL